MRASKNGELIDHGVYRSNQFQDVCLTKQAGPGGWRPTKYNSSDALWNEIDYGSTDVAGTVPDVRNLPPSVRVPGDGDRKANVFPNPFVEGLWLETPMATYEDPRFDEVRILGRSPTIVDVTFPTEPLSRATTGRVHSAREVEMPSFPKQALPPVPASARRHGESRRMPPFKPVVLSTASPFPDVQHWKPLLSPPKMGTRSPRWTRPSGLATTSNGMRDSPKRRRARVSSEPLPVRAASQPAEAAATSWSSDLPRRRQRQGVPHIDLVAIPDVQIKNIPPTPTQELALHQDNEADWPMKRKPLHSGLPGAGKAPIV